METCPYCAEEQHALKNHVRLTSGDGHGPSGTYPDDFEDGTSTDPVEVDELDEETVRQVARSSIYTWNFTNSTAEDVLDLTQTDTSGEPPASKAAEGLGPPG